MAFARPGLFSCHRPHPGLLAAELNPGWPESRVQGTERELYLGGLEEKEEESREGSGSARSSRTGTGRRTAPRLGPIMRVSGSVDIAQDISADCRLRKPSHVRGRHRSDSPQPGSKAAREIQIRIESSTGLEGQDRKGQDRMDDEQTPRRGRLAPPAGSSGRVHLSATPGR